MLDFGLEHPGSYMKSKQEGLKDHGKHYPSSNYNDEMAWGALWLYFATGVRWLPYRVWHWEYHNMLCCHRGPTGICG